jgi:nucleoside-diphosphate-sugar epimerase
MRALVTGAAGFIGSHLCEHLLKRGDVVCGIDALTDYYPVALKQRNLDAIREQAGFRIALGDIAELDLDPLLEGVDVVYHLAGQPGVTGSWGTQFAPYVRQNILATQVLLEACADRPPARFVFASSSSVYGEADAYPVAESAPTRPVSPYGVTKLAAEHLCHAYQTAFDIPVAALRLFTVYGPRQRPDMAFARLVDTALHGGTFELRGDGQHVRDCTYVADVVAAMRDAAMSSWSGAANIGGGSPASMAEVIDLVADLCGPFEVRRVGEVAGDVRRTEADTSLAASSFGYLPQTALREGLTAMVAARRESSLPT